jgi:hypothetical protein
VNLQDFIGVIPGALSREFCADAVARMRASKELQPGRIGGGVFPELKHSRDLSLQGNAAFKDIDATLNQAVLDATVAYVRACPQVLIAPLMLQQPDGSGGMRRLAAEDFADIDNDRLAALVRTCLRPGPVNLQWYRADEGGYPYWHCELYPRDANGETLHRHLLWTAYLNEEFEEGETEFLFQARKVKPETGSLLLAPTAFTHTHRGNRPKNGDKFIATSWILFQRGEVLFGNR